MKAISEKQVRLVYAKSGAKGYDAVQIEAWLTRLLGLSELSGAFYARRDWTDRTLKAFPRDRFSELLELIDNAPVNTQGLEQDARFRERKNLLSHETAVRSGDLQREGWAS
jgi:hypothetical protein